MPQRGGYQVRCARRAGWWEWDAALYTWGNGLRTDRKACEEVFAVEMCAVNVAI